MPNFEPSSRRSEPVFAPFTLPDPSISGCRAGSAIRSKIGSGGDGISRSTVSTVAHGGIVGPAPLRQAGRRTTARRARPTASMAITAPGGGCSAYCGYFAPSRSSACRRPHLVVLDHATRPVDPDPPERGPVVVVVVDQQRRLGVGGEVVEAAQRQGRLGLDVVDGGEHDLTVEDEAARHHVRTALGRHRGQPAHPGLGQSGPHRGLVHRRTLRPTPAGAPRPIVSWHV